MRWLGLALLGILIAAASRSPPAASPASRSASPRNRSPPAMRWRRAPARPRHPAHRQAAPIAGPTGNRAHRSNAAAVRRPTAAEPEPPTYSPPPTAPATAAQRTEPSAAATASRTVGQRRRRRLSSGRDRARPARGAGSPASVAGMGDHMDDGEVRHPPQAVGQAEPEPARDAAGKGGDDDLVELAARAGRRRRPRPDRDRRRSPPRPRGPPAACGERPLSARGGLPARPPSCRPPRPGRGARRGREG